MTRTTAVAIRIPLTAAFTLMALSLNAPPKQDGAALLLLAIIVSGAWNFSRWLIPDSTNAPGRR